MSVGGRPASSPWTIVTSIRRRTPPGRRLLVAAILAILAGLAPAAGAAEGGAPPEADTPAPTGDHHQVVDLTFPAPPDVYFSDSYEAPRSGGARVHKAADLMGEKHSPVYAAVDGEVCYVTGLDGAPPSWGFMLAICGDDGRRYEYIHMNNDTPGTDDGAGGPVHAYAPGIHRGARVVRGQLVGWMGDSGNAEETAPHLHFMIEDDAVVDPYGSNYINPYPSLMAALARGDVPDGSILARLDTRRVAGTDRVGTAIGLSREIHEAADTVVLAPSVRPSEAIIAGPLAAVLDAPVLTTPPGALDERVVGEIRRLGATEAILVGPLDGIGAPALEAAGIDAAAVRRFVGEDVFATAALVADEVWTLTGAVRDGDRAHHRDDRDESWDAPRRALLALGRHPDEARTWPDALMASYAGSLTGTPVLLTDVGKLPAATADALRGVDAVTILGGEAAIWADVEEEVDALVDRTRRLWGRSRFGTAAAVTQDLVDRDVVDQRSLWAATGWNWPDAATSGPVVAAAGGLLTLVDGTAAGRDVEIREWLTSKDAPLDEVVVIGGTRAVNDHAAASVAGWAA